MNIAILKDSLSSICGITSMWTSMRTNSWSMDTYRMSHGLTVRGVAICVWYRATTESTETMLRTLVRTLVPIHLYRVRSSNSGCCSTLHRNHESHCVRVLESCRDYQNSSTSFNRIYKSGYIWDQFCN
ncbi:PREDICTED: uncharacterized protein LOC108564405 [Nicrophorus vespilloides]|uniref:Uncharacterized protein LOC108564405 n=1 Tax=Nicrophorus vespilloides TaxID=110193 RepID=A0ABM1MWI2_NICVS|nr:PREDICTED: uncharacterized protein LOC108564405 [Nicrophorus vespilloides]XP_017778933.1 PREDICTED: uncharacterized protein LOC108564405 [Nicrophorus vespilloides]